MLSGLFYFSGIRYMIVSGCFVYNQIFKELSSLVGTSKVYQYYKPLQKSSFSFDLCSIPSVWLILLILRFSFRLRELCSLRIILSFLKPCPWSVEFYLSAMFSGICKYYVSYQGHIMGAEWNVICVVNCLIIMKMFLSYYDKHNTGADDEPSCIGYLMIFPQGLLTSWTRAYLSLL